MKEAQWWRSLNGKIECYLCPRYCKIGPNQIGFCVIRKNQDGKLWTLGYGYPTAVNIDPIEKKPLYHFYPSTNILSLGNVGCNLGCLFCQNWDISKAKEHHRLAKEWEPEIVVAAALKYKCPAIAFTYNEPTIWAEYAIDISKIAHQYNIKTVMVTNGYITAEAFHDVYDYIDAANVDLKSFSEEFYKKYTLSHLKPVLEILKLMKKESKVWFEITTLLIPGLNDSQREIKELTGWIVNELGSEVPLHFSAFHPDYKLLDRPPTPIRTLEIARSIALENGIKYVYIGNVFSEYSNTYCPKCNKLLIKRNWHTVSFMNLKGNKCSCGETIPGYF